MSTPFDRLREILKQGSAGQPETWGFVAMFIDMIDQAESEYRRPVQPSAEKGWNRTDLSHVWNTDAPDGQCWQCPDCESWASLGGNAAYHANQAKHGVPTLRPIAPPATPTAQAEPTELRNLAREAWKKLSREPVPYWVFETGFIEGQKSCEVPAQAEPSDELNETKLRAAMEADMQQWFTNSLTPDRGYETPIDNLRQFFCDAIKAAMGMGK